MIENSIIRYYVYTIKSKELDSIDPFIMKTHEISLYLKNSIKKILQLEATPKVINRNSILGISKIDLFNIPESKVENEMKLLKECYSKLEIKKKK